jgi:hypothetical protein
MGKRALRRCLYRECRKYFNSRSPAERICPKCRKKHKARLNGVAGMDVIQMTPAMSKHIEMVETFGSGRYKDPSADFKASVDDYIEDEDNNDFDDSQIYEEIKINKEEFDYDEEELDKENDAIVEILRKKPIMKRGPKKTKDELFEFI